MTNCRTSGNRVLLVFSLSGFLTIFLSCNAYAHAFAAPYTLPVPLWLYAYGSTAALVVSFMFFALFSSHAVALPGNISASDPDPKLTESAGTSIAVVVLQAASGLLLAATILCGLIGTQNPMLNFNMTWFWIIFYLGFYYLAAIIGDFYAFCNPWAGLCRVIEQLAGLEFNGVTKYPGPIGYYPALAAYGCVVVLELFGHANPHALSIFLLGYTAYSLVGAWLFGKEDWFKYGDAFGVLFSMAGALAPIRWETSSTHLRARFRPIFGGLQDASRSSVSLTIFVLFMLSSTAFDGLHDSIAWNSTFWVCLYPVMEPVLMRYSRDPYGASTTIYHAWQIFSLLISPFVYLLGYVSVIELGRRMVGSKIPLGFLIKDFSLSLVPIAFFYNVTHYYTVAISQAQEILPLTSDPLGFRWNLLGINGSTSMPWMINASFVWHSQVALILLGHIVSVYLAHTQSFRTYHDRKQAILSQIPMVILMVVLTTSGLWILSLPMGSTG